MAEVTRDSAPPRPLIHRIAAALPYPRFRGLSLAKTALAAFIGCVMAIAVAQKPLTAPLPNTLTIADMTWLEVRSAIAHGYATVIVPTGGIEQNGPHMILGKHDRIVAWTAQRIASELGQTLVAPVVSFVPEGDYNPPTGHMRFPGTIGVPEKVFADMLEGIARSLRASGFKLILLIGDHGGSQKAQAEVAARLTAEWAREYVRVINVSDYYQLAGDEQMKLLQREGETAAAIGQHAGIMDTSELMAAHPAGVDLGRLSSLPFSLEAAGFDGDPRKATAERGKTLLMLKIEAAVRQIRAAFGEMKS